MSERHNFTQEGMLLPSLNSISNDACSHLYLLFFHLASLTVPNYCVLDGCDSQGHVDGVRKNHITLSGCPRFHNQVPSFYQELANKNKQINGGGDTAIENITTDRQYVRETEPDYGGLGTAEDIDLFRRAQQKLASDKVSIVSSLILACSCCLNVFFIVKGSH